MKNGKKKKKYQKHNCKKKNMYCHIMYIMPSILIYINGQQLQKNINNVSIMVKNVLQKYTYFGNKMRNILWN